MSDYTGLRGTVWFRALTGHAAPLPGDPKSVLTADASIGVDRARFLCVVPNPDARFPCARHGEVGLEEAYTLATRISEVVAQDTDAAKRRPIEPNRDGTTKRSIEQDPGGMTKRSLEQDLDGAAKRSLEQDPGGAAKRSVEQGADASRKRPIIAIVDVRSQAYGRREETAAIFLAAAAAADAYGSARLAGHPVITLVVGHALSGGFLTHGYQANRILAFDDAGVMIHAMHKEAAARITRRSVESLEKLAKTIPPLSYDVKDFARLGVLHKLLHVENPDKPSDSDVQQVRSELAAAIEDARRGPFDLRNRLESPAARETRQASILTRARLESQWREEA